MINVNFKLVEEIQSLITPLTTDEKGQLERNLIKDGCREVLTVWLKSKNVKVLIDGHHRYEICIENDIKFDTIELVFDSMEEVIDWMIDNQLGRRNLNPDQLSFYRGLKYNRLKLKKGGYDKVLSKGQSDHLTSEILANTYNVSEKTIRRDAQYARGLQIISQSNVGLMNDILIGNTKMNKATIIGLTFAQDADNLKIRNEADLYNKVETIKRKNEDSRLRKVEDEIDERLDRANKILDEMDPLFQSRDEKINKMKGRILSMMNKAIKYRKRELISELIELIRKLEELLVDKQ